MGNFAPEHLNPNTFLFLPYLSQNRGSDKAKKKDVNLPFATDRNIGKFTVGVFVCVFFQQIK